ncbi:radical SAM protein [Desulfofustis limnaeus]|uniref:Radical SAM protein n=2 Tax=Desulfofustis limnaeus TaxID=2740163 RepID=A0ABM7WAR0_9BACT|nr:radical SAM protein [Desulfofustis limnaeus]
MLGHCGLCPRRCRVNRLINQTGFCATGRFARIASYGPHFGEEQPLVGRHGSGTIFIASCNLRCCFCQNYEISHTPNSYPEVDAAGLAAFMIDLQNQGCHNINLVTPSHVLPQIIEALPIALQEGLRVPLVYNCSGYESPEALALLDGIVDIYLVDFKFWDAGRATTYLNAPDYPEVARQALTIMHHQVGDLMIDNTGLAVSGLLVRHLLMPDSLEETAAIVKFIADRISPATYCTIMDQYRPCGQAASYPELRQPITAEQYQQALELAAAAGLSRIDRRDLGMLLRRLGII